MSTLTQKDLGFIHEHLKDNFKLLTTLGKIPAPSHQEDKRAAFCLEYIKSLGAESVTIDAAKNVVCEIGCEGKEQVVILSAHTDVVFPDLDELKAAGRDVTVEMLGIRPENRVTPPAGLDTLTNRNMEILRQYLEGPLDRSPYSTDSNLPLSLEIPANTIGAVQGAGAHTYGEWLYFPFQETGMKIVISILKQYWTV